MGAGSSQREVEVNSVDVRVRVARFRIGHFDFNQYQRFPANFQRKLPQPVWFEFRQCVETALNPYLNAIDWSCSYQFASYLALPLNFLCLIFGIVSIVMLALAASDSTPWYLFAIFLLLTICCGFFGIRLRTKAKRLKTEYHTQITQRVRRAVGTLNDKYTGQCRFHLETVYGLTNLNWDSGCVLRMFFKITVLVQRVEQPSALPVQQGAAQIAQQQHVMIQMPDGNMVMANLVSPAAAAGQQPPAYNPNAASPPVVYPQVVQQPQQQQTIVQHVPQPMVPVEQSPPYQQQDAPPAYGDINGNQTGNGEGGQGEGEGTWQ